MINQRQKIIVVVGPTASGKSDLGIKLARKFHGEIISADSRQVYRGMNIGTGKVTKKEQKLAKHYLLDIVSPRKVFTASDFKKYGDRAIKEILEKNKIPIVVGGTGFYIDILLGQMAAAEVPPNKKLRSELEKQTTEKLFKILSKLDPTTGKRIDRHNRRRLVRAIEIAKAVGKVPKIPSLTKKYDLLWLGINPGKEKLAKRIKTRLEKRIRSGMVAEVRRLLKSGISKKRLEDLGLEYRWLSRYLNNEVSHDEMRFGLLRDIVKYSKRQMTWFKRNKDINWIKKESGAIKLSLKFLTG